MPLLSTLTNIGLIKRRKSSPLAEVLITQKESTSRPTLPKRLTLVAQTQHLAYAAQVTITNIRAEPPLAEVLVNQKPKPVLVDTSERLSLLTRTRQLFHDLFGDTRQQYEQSLSNNYEAHTEQAVERMAKRSLVVAITGFGFATAAIFVSPLLYWPSIGCTVYVVRKFIQEGYRLLVEERRLDYHIIYISGTSAALLGGFIWAAAFAVVFAQANRYLVAKTERRSKRHISDLFGGQIRTVWLLIEGVEIETPIEQVQSGDIVMVQAGQMIPVDGVIVSGTATIDQHILTGEAQPVEKEVGDHVLASTVILAGRLGIQVHQAGKTTVAAQITHMLNQTSDFKQTLQSRTDRMLNQLLLPILGASVLALPIAGLSGAVAVQWYYPGWRMLFFGPVSMLSYLQIAAQRGILVKDGRALEVLDEVDTVVFDKTGTLTLEQPTLSRIISCGCLTEMDVLRYAAAAEIKQSHPIARAIVQAATDYQLDLPPLEEAQVKVGYGLKTQIEGQVVLIGSFRFMTLEGLTIPPELAAQQVESQAQGHSLVWLALNNDVVGVIELQPTIRPETEAIIQDLHDRGFATVIISGDHETPTRQLATALGIDRYFAEVLPEDKAKLVKQLQAEGHKVCFVGDGINDSIALKMADVAVSLRGATTIATDTAHIVFMDGTLGQLPTLFNLTDEFADTMRLNMLAAFVPGMVGIVGTFLFGWGMTLCVLIMQGSTPIGVYNALKPMLNDRNKQQKRLQP